MPPAEDKRSKRTDAVRAAVDQAFQATAGQAQVTRDRAGGIADDIAEELATAAGRVRGALGALEDLRPAAGAGPGQELAALRERVAALEAKVADLERGTTPKPSAASGSRLSSPTTR